MRCLLSIALLALLGCNTAPDSTTDTTAKGPDNLVLLPIPQSDHVTIKLMFRLGSIDDPADKLGLSNLTVQTVANGGNQRLSKAEIDELLYPMAIDIDASVGKEATVFTMTAHKDNLDKAYEVLSGLIRNPRFDQGDFDREMKNAERAVTQDVPQNNDEVLSKRALDKLMFAGHPYEHLVQGSVSGLASITLDDVKAHHQKYFCTSRLMIGLAGGYSDAFKQRVLDDMATLPKGDDTLVELPPVPMPNGVELMTVVKERAFGTAIFMGYPLAIDRGSDEFAALMVAKSYFGEHRKSYGLLYNQMRTARSLNYGDYAYIEWYQSGHATQLPWPGYPRRQNFFSIWIRPVQIASEFADVPGLEPPELGNGVHSIRQPLRALENLVAEGISQEDFDRTRKFLIGYTKLYVQSPSARLGYLMDSRFYGREDYITEIGAELEKLTLDDVNNAIRKYLQAKNMYIAVITDDSEAEKLTKALAENLSAPIVYKPQVRAGLPEEILSEDEEIDAYELNVTSTKVVKNAELFQ